MSITTLRIGKPGASRITLVGGFMGGASSWDAVLGYLPVDLDVRFVDLPGHGREAPPSAATWGDAVASLASEITSEPNRSEIVVGYSMGARIALAIALEKASRFTRVIAVGADLGIVDARARAARVAEDEVRASELEERGVAAFVERWEALPIFATQARLPLALLEKQRALRKRHDPVGLAWALRTLGTGRMPDLRPLLSQSNLAFSFVAGALDQKFLLLAEEGARTARIGEVVRTPDAGHNVPLEAPEALAALIAQYAVSERSVCERSAVKRIEDVKESVMQQFMSREEPRHE